MKSWRKAADKGVAEAQYNLGIMYGRGQGVPQDYVETHMWFNLPVPFAAATLAARISDER